MSFVSLGGDGTTRPTFFELVAAERLMPSLKAATIYSLSVFAQRRHYFHRVLNYEDEVFALITLLLDRQSLANGSASFADSLYGLRRAPFSADSAGEKQQPLTKRQRMTALLCLIGLPYLQAKLQKLYERHAGPAGVASSPTLTAAPTLQEESLLGSPLGWLQRCRRGALPMFIRIYPWANGAAEGLHFCYQLMYLLNSSPFYTPVLRLLQQHIVRVSGQELVEAERAKSIRRRGQLQRAKASLWLTSLLRQGLLKAGYAFADHSRNALILAVFAFKLLEWWYTSAEHKLASQQKLPIPPPPPLLAPHPNGVSLPSDPAHCPLCRHKRTNPAMAVPTGYVFCYPCIFNHISQFGCCPVTRIPANVDQIRRLYQSQ